MVEDCGQKGVRGPQRWVALVHQEVPAICVQLLEYLTSKYIIRGAAAVSAAGQMKGDPPYGGAAREGGGCDLSNARWGLFTTACATSMVTERPWVRDPRSAVVSRLTDLLLYAYLTDRPGLSRMPYKGQRPDTSLWFILLYHFSDVTSVNSELPHAQLAQAR